MPKSKISIASIRKAEIVDAAIAVIARKGLQGLSLSEIEKVASMSRGQLTYYFPSKESILLAVFDRMLELLQNEVSGFVSLNVGRNKGKFIGWQKVSALVNHFIESQPLSDPFHALEFTFLSQISHRQDFKRRLSELYEDWRTQMALDLDSKNKNESKYRDFATLVQAILHGLNIQKAADPKSFDPQTMSRLVLDVLSSYLFKIGKPKKKRKEASASGVRS